MKQPIHEAHRKLVEYIGRQSLRREFKTRLRGVYFVLE